VVEEAVEVEAVEVARGVVAAVVPGNPRILATLSSSFATRMAFPFLPLTLASSPSRRQAYPYQQLEQYRHVRQRRPMRHA
jgi:hypothetical protein